MNDYEQLKNHAARFAWTRRNERTPSGKRTWAEWWQLKFGGGESLDEYRARVKTASGA